MRHTCCPVTVGTVNVFCCELSTLSQWHWGIFSSPSSSSSPQPSATSKHCWSLHQQVTASDLKVCLCLCLGTGQDISDAPELGRAVMPWPRWLQHEERSRRTVSTTQGQCRCPCSYQADPISSPANNVDVYKYARIYAYCLYVTQTECHLFSSFYWFYAMV